MPPGPENVVVENGDSITTDIVDKNVKVSIKWEQNGKPREQSYVSAVFHVPSKDILGALFVQEDMLEDFKKLGPSGSWTVNNDFQYGQASGGKNRRLVYHDKTQKPYQHRYIKGIADHVGDAAQDVLKNMGYTAGESVASFINPATGLFGNYLKDFDPLKYLAVGTIGKQ